jgi:hypothetical protein
MAGGIQPGTEAGSKESKQLDGDVRSVALAIAQAQDQYFYEQGHRNLTSGRINESVRDAASLPELVEKGITLGCVPDGGMWFDGDRSTPNRKLKVVFEAKHQGTGGNAIERWGTNHDICKAINPDCTYVTFATGAGAVNGEVLHRHGTNMEIIHGKNVQWHYKPEGFSQEEIFNIMKTTLALDSLTFDKVTPYIGKKIARFTTFDDLFEELTPEEIVAEMLVKQKLNNVDDLFVEILQDTRNPMTQAWNRISKEDKLDAKEMALDMLNDGETPETIAEVYANTFVLTVKPRLNT